MENSTNGVQLHMWGDGDAKEYHEWVVSATKQLPRLLFFPIVRTLHSTENFFSWAFDMDRGQKAQHGSFLLYSGIYS